MSMKELSRRDFIKGAAGAAGIAALGVLAGCSNNEPEATPTPAANNEEKKGIYTPGTYSAKAKGFNDLIVTMTFSADAITDVVLDVSGETENYGQAAAEELKTKLMEAQGAEIEAVSGATLTSRGVMEAANKCIQQAKGEIPVEVIDNSNGETASAGWLGTAPEITDISETWDTDLLIVGAGNAGLAAGAYAAKHGVKFRMIEKMETLGKVRNWYAAVDSVDSKAQGGEKVDRTRMLNELKRYSSGKLNMRAWQTWMNESAGMHDFVKEMYAKYAPDMNVTVTVGDEAVWPESEGFYFPQVEHFWGFGGEMNRNQMFEAYMKENGTEIDFNTSLVKIEREGNKITGVIAQNTETDKYIRINAAKGVIIATGGYLANTDMMEQLDPLGTSVISCFGGAAQDDGYGIRAGVWAGAAMQEEPAPMLFDRGIIEPGKDAGYETLSTGGKAFRGSYGQFNMGSQPFLKVNRHGKRFTNESGTYDMMSYAAGNQPGQVYAMVMDDNMYADAQRFHTLGCSAMTRNSSEESMKKNLEKAMEQGLAFKADTLDDLADKLGFKGDDKTNFLATCERYNELYDNQEDVDFGKPAYRLSALKKAPYYGFWMGAVILTTEQGLLVDENSRVLDAETKEPLDGLFAAGDCAGGFFINNYPCLMPGVACSKAMTFGIKSVKVAAGIDE